MIVICDTVAICILYASVGTKNNAGCCCHAKRRQFKTALTRLSTTKD